MATINAFALFKNEEGIYDYNEGVPEEDFPTSDWIHNPDISEVDGIFDPIYWIWDPATQKVRVMTPDEQISVDEFEEGDLPDDQTETPISFSRVINGSRVYLTKKSGYARTWNTAYGPTYHHWASQIKLNAITHRVRGLNRKGAFRLKSVHMDGFFSTGSTTSMKVHVIKVSKTKDTYSADNNIVWTSNEIVSSGTQNREYNFPMPANLNFADGEAVTLAWERTDSNGGTRFFYFDELRLEMEKN